MTEQKSNTPPSKEGQGHALVTIEVDGAKFEVERGKWVVSDLKTKTGVDPTKILAEISPHGLKDLEDAGHIEIKDGDRFMSHARSGASS